MVTALSTKMLERAVFVVIFSLVPSLKGKDKTMKKALVCIFIFLAPLYSQKYSFKVKIEGKGSPVLFIPGLACSGEVWEETVENLKEKYRCYVFTLPGFAEQPPRKAQGNYLQSLQTEIAEYIREELSEKPVLVGHSLGGFLALAIASENPELVKKIIVTDAYPFLPAAYNPAATAENFKPQAEVMKQMLLKMSEKDFERQQKMTLSSMITAPEKIELALKWSLQSDRETVARAMFEMMTTDLRENISKIQVPVLVPGSWAAAKNFGLTKQDVEENLKKQYKNVKNCQIFVAEKAKHFIMWDEPEWFLKKLQTFLENEG